METPSSFSVFAIDDDFLNEWFDSFHPSVKTFATNFVINKLRRYDFNPDAIEDGDDKCLANLLVNHFSAFLKLKIMDENPGRVVTDIYLPLE
jgi:hypothetical protein